MIRDAVTNTDDLIDVRDIIERYEELEDERDDNELDTDDEAEFITLKDLLDELKGNGGDEKWEGDWYPITLIHDRYFVDYAEELIKDCGEMPRDTPGYIEIDWKATADNIQIDYCSIDFNGQTYWYR